MVGHLDRTGYLVLFGGSALALWLGRGRLELGIGRPGAWLRLRRRLRRPLPCWFAVLACLAFVGGLLYAPSGHTALSYRIPRVLHWLSEGRWHWIHTADYRLNNRACGIEWLTAPILLFTRSDRALFLLNLVPFLLLPGLVFSVWRRLGVAPRVAWHWMWLLPTGYAFLLQAGSAGNDAFPAPYALAALDFGLRAWNSRRPADLFWSLLAAALLTGAKASNLPLLLPWALVVAPLALALLRRPWATAAVLAVCLVVSFLPTAALNQAYCRDWSGLKLERPGMNQRDPWVGLWGNPALILLDNFVPPFFPAAGWWNESAFKVLPPGVVKPLVDNFENGFEQLKELQTEDWAGLGFGLSVLVTVSFFAGLAVRRRPETARSRAPRVGEGSAKPDDRPPAWIRRAALLGAWAALGAYCLKSGMSNGARLIAPYYPLLLPLLALGRGHRDLVRRGWWRLSAAGVVGLAAIVLVVTPGRPLWPARTVLSRASATRPGSRLLSRAREAYAVYAERWDPLANVRALLPPDVKVVGFLADADDLDISFWRPYFTRRVRPVLLEDPPAEILREQVRYIVVNAGYLAWRHTSLDEWQRRVGAELVASTTATLKVAQGPQTWDVVRIPATGPRP